jgi:hypothetical protein
LRFNHLYTGYADLLRISIEVSRDSQTVYNSYIPKASQVAANFIREHELR